MQSIPLQAIPNQEFTVVLNNNQWKITLRTTAGVTSATVSLNGTEIVSNSRCVANGLVIPYEYLESGNFLFLTQNYQLPEYTQFNTTQYLVYITAEEMAAFRVPLSSPITAADFSPIAALPLRFAPQGYTLA
jgi:hypothetical protein